MKKLFAFLACTVVLNAFIPACADEEAAKDKETEKPTRVLEGGVKGTAIMFDDGVAKIEIARTLIQESCAKIMKEATRKDTVVMRGPNAIGNGIVIPALGGAGGVMQFGDLPMRRDRLERWVTENDQNVAALQSYIDALALPADKAESMKELYASMRATMQQAQDALTQLKDLSGQKRLPNIKIGKAALRIYDAMGKLQKQRDEMLQIASGAVVTTTTESPATQSTTAEPAKPN